MNTLFGQTMSGPQILQLIFQQFAIPQLRSSPFQPPTFMHDNAPCNISNKVKSILVDNGLQVSDGQASSVSASTIQKIFIRTLVIRWETRILKTRRALGALENWMELSCTIIIQKMIDACGKRCQELIISKGNFF